MEWDVRTLKIEVCTYKEGFLSKLAHDLRLKSTQHRATLSGAQLVATIDLAGLRVMHAESRGRPAMSALSASDKQQIERSMRDQVLEITQYPAATFEGELSSRRKDGAQLVGTLSLHGQTRPLEIPLQRSVDGAWAGSIELQTPDYGVRPFRAMMGALKLKPKVTVEMRFTTDEPLFPAESTR